MDERAYPGSRAGNTLEESLSQYDLPLPGCALTEARFWDAPKEDDWSRNIILRLPLPEDCSGSLLSSLGMVPDDFIAGVGVPPYWAYDVDGNPYGERDTAVRVRDGRVVLPPTLQRDSKDMQVEISVEDGAPMVAHVRAIMP